MSSVMIRCPNTGRAVSTAIEIEPSVFRKLPKISARMLCPACGQEHDWNDELGLACRRAAAGRRSEPAGANDDRQGGLARLAEPHRGFADRPTPVATRRARPW